MKVRIGAIAIAAVWAAGCRSPTEITVAVTTQIPCAKIGETAIQVGPLSTFDLGSGLAPASTAPQCTSDGTIGALVIVPSGDDGALVAVKIVTAPTGLAPEACGPSSGCIVAKRALHFIPHDSLTVKVEMTDNCRDDRCNPDDTCFEGACVSATISDPTACEGNGCGGEVLGQGQGEPATVDAGVDATVADAGGEAEADAGADAEAEADAPTDAPIADGTTFASLAGFALGRFSACALMADHTVRCWGSELSGMLGNGVDDASAYALVPQPVPGFDHVEAIVAGYEHYCARLDDGGVSCWGYSGNYATGNSNTTDLLTPTHVAVPVAAGMMTAGADQACVTSTDDRALWCWGAWRGYDVLSGAPSPMLDAGSAVVQLASGGGMECGRFADGTTRCWGQNWYSALGIGSTDQDAESDAAIVLPGASGLIQIAMGGGHVCGVTAANTLLCWGDDTLNALGPNVDSGATGILTVPTDVGIDHVLKVGCGVDHTCALFEDGGVSCWGDNEHLQLGAPAAGNGTPELTHVTGLSAATDLIVGANNGCARQTDGKVLCWGDDSNAQLGNGSAPNTIVAGAVPVAF